MYKIRLPHKVTCMCYHNLKNEFFVVSNAVEINKRAWRKTDKFEPTSRNGLSLETLVLCTKAISTGNSFENIDDVDLRRMIWKMLLLKLLGEYQIKLGSAFKHVWRNRIIYNYCTENREKRCFSVVYRVMCKLTTLDIQLLQWDSCDTTCPWSVDGVSQDS